MWILILTIQWSPYHPAAMATAEFSDAKACSIAAESWTAKHKKSDLSAFCFPKSSTIPERKQ